MQAAIASLFEMKIKDVPNFMDYGTAWSEIYFEFLKEHGYEYVGYLQGDDLKHLKSYSGIDGLFHAAVYSPNHYNRDDENPAKHAVIVDKDLNIVHDPNKLYENVTEYPEKNIIGNNGILYVYLVKKNKSDG